MNKLLNNIKQRRIEYKSNPSLMNEEERDRVNTVLTRVENMKMVRQPQLTKWEDNLRRQVGDKNISDIEASRYGKNNLRIQIERALVESKTSDEIDTLPFPIVGALREKDNEYANNFQLLFDYVVNDVIKLKRTIIDMYMKSKNTHGDGILKVYWYVEKRKIRVPKKKVGKTITYQDKIITSYENIKVENIDLRMFLIDPICFQPNKNIDDARYCAFFQLYDYDEFKNVFGNNDKYKNIDMVNPGRMYDNDYKPTKAENDADLYQNLVEVIEYWDITKDEHCYLANGVEIYSEACPYYNPFTEEKYLPIAHFVNHINATGFYNAGDIEIVKELVEEKETQRRINIDAAKGYTHPWIVVGGMNDVDVDEFVGGINTLLEVDDINQIKQLNLAGNTGLPFQLEASNSNDITTITGHDINGVLGNDTQTATQTLEKKEVAIKRIRFGNTVNELSGFVRLYDIIKNLILQYYKESEISEIVAKDGFGNKIFMNLKENKKMFNRDYMISIVPNNQIPSSKEISKLRNQETLGILSQLPFAPDGSLPPAIAMAVKKILIENMQLTEEQANLVSPQEQTEQPNELDTALKQLETNMYGGEEDQGSFGDGFEQKGTPPASASGSIQERVQSTVQNIVPTKSL